MLLGGRSAVRGRCVSRRRAPRALPTQGERSLCLKLCVRARGLAIVGRHKMSTAQVNARIILARPMGNGYAAPKAVGLAACKILGIRHASGAQQ